MKKITLLCAMLLFSIAGFSQTLNQAASWPNATWTLSGTYDAPSLLSDPTTTTNFSYNDDGAGSGSTDILNAESPAIDLTAAHGAGETWLTVAYDYDYNLGAVFNIEYYDADGAAWVIWDAIVDNSTAQSAWCAAIAAPAVTSSVLDISGFTPTQLSGFQYRFNYDASSTWGWGFCMSSPTITSASPPSCLDPNTLTAANVMPTSADLGWTTGGSGEANWEIVVQAAGTGAPAGSGTSTVGANPYSAGSLTAATDYEFYVRADCGGSGFSGWAGPFAFTTACATFTPDYTNDFTTFLPSCWEEGDDTTIIAGPNNTNGIWAVDGFLNAGGTGATKVNMYNVGDMDWLVSPTFDLSVDGYELKFDVGVTAWGASTASAMGSDDEVQVLISNDNGATWISLETFNAGNTPSNTGDAKTYDLTGYVSATTKFAFWATEGAVDDAEDYDFFIDNFVVRTPPSCVEPSALTAANIMATSADLGWTTGGSGEANWEIVVQAAGTGAPAGSGTSTAGANPYSAGSLTAATDYEFYVRADCGGSGFSAWVGPYAFTTLCATITPAYTNDFTTFLGNCWEEGNDTDILTGPNNTNGAWGADGFLNVGTTGAAKINLYNTGDQDWIVSPTFDFSAGSLGLAFDVGVTTFAGTGASAMGSDDEVQVLISNDDGATWISLETFNVGNTPSNTGDAKLYDLAAYTSATTKFAFWATEGAVDDAEDYDFFIDNFRVDAYAVLGVADLKLVEGFKAYPNPVIDELTVSAKSEIKQLSIVNMLGQTVRTVTPNSRDYKLNLTDLTSGIYFVKATVNNTEGTFRIVKK